MTRFVVPLPYDMADAMRILTDPSAHRGQPAIRGAAWHMLKEARGQDVDFARLDAMHHQLVPAPRRSLADDLIARAEAVIPRVRARRDQLRTAPIDGEGA